MTCTKKTDGKESLGSVESVGIGRKNRRIGRKESIGVVEGHVLWHFFAIAKA